MGFWDGHAERVNHYATSIRIFRSSKFFSRKKIRGSEIKDIMWFNPGGIDRRPGMRNIVECLRDGLFILHRRHGRYRLSVSSPDYSTAIFEENG